tara:strand:- start:19 stop:1083 length:1065 start_codon:yes stop_codon:yes gene_type:complete
MNNFFFIFCIIVLLFKTQTVFSNNLIYDVNNIVVSGRINNNSDKKKLIKSSFRKAFIIFINKTLLKNDAVNLYSTKINTIEDLVFAYQVVKNKKNKKENILMVNVKFDQKKIINFLAQNKISYADVENISLTLLPVFIKEKEVFIYADNFFYNNWIKSQNKKENNNDILIKYNLALENAEDLQYINSNKNNLELIDVKKISSLDSEKNYAILIIYFTEDKFRAYVKTYIRNKKIDKNVELKIYPENDKKTYEEAMLTLKEEIKQIWKSQNLIDVNTPSFLDLVLDVQKINDYLILSSIFDSIDVIENYSVLEMTNEHTKIRLRYKGKLNKLNDKLLQKKVNIKIVDNTWMVKIN